MPADRFTELFPIPYAHWYAACLFIETGHPAPQVLERLGVRPEDWRALDNRYGNLHFANMGWVASAYAREGLPPPASDEALYAHLLAGGDIMPKRVEPLSLRDQLRALRRAVEADPRIGPFADTGWTAVYICERGFPTIRYLHDGERVMVDGAPLADRNGKPMAGIDLQSFRQLGDRWFRDEARVYGQAETPTKIFWFVARGADPETFTVLNERYAADRAAGYYITNRRLPTAEPGSFEIVGYYYGRGQKPGFHIHESHYARDSEKVYAYGSPIEGAHAPSFAAIGDEGRYFADRDRIYWEKFPIPDADRETFVCASEAGQYHAFDKDRPYLRGKPQSVSAEFERWREFFENHPELTGTWWHREKARRAQQAENPSELKPLGGPYFSDGARVLVVPRNRRRGDTVSLDHFDHDSFRHIVDVFGVDKNGLRYVEPGLEAYGREPVRGADPETFTALGEGWYRDKRQVYYLGPDDSMPTLIVVKADPDSFETLGGVYARDAKGLIAEGVRKRDIADPGAVVSLGKTFARMGDALLYRGRVVKNAGKLDPDTARGLHPLLLIDAGGHMLVMGRYRKPIAGLDPQTLEILNASFAADKSGVYAISPDGLVPGEAIDRASVRTDGDYAVIDKAGRHHLSGSFIHSEPRD